MVCRRGGLPDFWTLGPLVLWTICLAACAPNHLPDQDLRILTAQPSAKMPPGDLWKDFEKDVVAARAQYFGQAIDLSGRITSIEADTSKGRMNKKIREGRDQRIPYMLIVGDRDVENGTVSVRLRTDEDLGAMPVGGFIDMAKHVIDHKLMSLQ